MPRSTSLSTSTSSISAYRRGLVPGGSEQFNRYKILKRHQIRLNNSNRIVEADLSDDSNNSDHLLETDPDVEIKTVVDHVRIFSNDLYLPLREKHPVNLVYSPLGFCISAVILKLACKGIGQTELTSALFPGDYTKGDCTNESTETVVGLSALLGWIQGCSPAPFTFKHAYKLFMDSQHAPKMSFLNRVKTIYNKIDVEEVNFAKDSWDHVSHKINQWAHFAASNKLGDILTKRTTNNKIIFVNPIYFIGNWVHPFNPALTKPMSFTINESEVIQVPMMVSGILKNLLYSPFNKLDCRALVLPYKGDRLGLVIFLPNNKDGIGLIESKLDSLSPAQYFKEMHAFRSKLSSQSGCQVFLPTFKIDCTLDLQGPMKEMGIETIFNAGKADFAGLAHFSSKELSVTQILQKVVLDVNEVGTENPIHFGNTPALPKEPGSSDSLGTDFDLIEFRVDRPFYFQVVDMKSDLIILAGVCKNPKQRTGLEFRDFLKKYEIQLPSKWNESQEIQENHVVKS